MSGEKGKVLKLNPSEWSRGARILFKLFVAMLIAASSNIIIASFSETPKMSSIRRENKRLEDRYRILSGKIASAERTLSDLKHRDHYVYRPILGVDTLNIPEVYSDYVDSKYASLLDDEYYGDVTYDMWLRMDRLMRRIYYASLSLDATQELAMEKAEYSSIIPAIWPIDRTRLVRVASLFGMRNHPTLGIWRMHEGVDLTAPTGTAVYASGNGTISFSGTQGGYGQLVEVNHGHGYTTRYAHLSTRYVEKGEKVTRGQVIGEVGSTGESTGPHLHYEVRYRNNPVNPIHYFDKDMSEESYREVMEQIEHLNK